MGVKGKRPKMFQKGEAKKVGRKSINAMTREILDELQKTAVKVENVSITRMPNYLQITEEKLERNGVVDLKKAFARSSKKRYDKKGNWYLIIPIRLKTSSMSKSTYQDLRNLQVSSGSRTIKTNYLEELNRPEATHPALIPRPPSKNTTKVKKKGQRNASYFMFRRVSAKSPANSWILNRHTVNSNNYSKTMLKNVQRLMNWKMEHLR